MIKRGDKGIEVTKLQRQLMELGYNLPQFGADGDFGLETETVLKRYQSDAGLPVTGVADEMTMSFMFAKSVEFSDAVVAKPNLLTRITGDKRMLVGIGILGVLLLTAMGKKRSKA